MLRHARTLRAGLTILLGAAFWVTSAGCTHNYYYGAVPVGCAPSPVVSPSGVQYGSVCEVPSQVVGGGTVIATNPPGNAPALSGPRPPRVVLSETPSWLRADPDAGPAITSVEGAVGEPTSTR